MKFNRGLDIALLILGTVALTAGSSTRDLTIPERDRAVQYLEVTKKGLLDAVRGLSDAQWHFKPAPDRWSIAEVVEHIAVVEELIDSKMLAHLADAPAAPPDRDPSETDSMILTRMPDRSTKAQAPKEILPTGRWTPAEARDHFLQARKTTFELLKSTPDLRGHLIAHPAFGPLDGYEWILAIAGHSDRHTKQILEVKADPNFPAK